MLMHDLRRLRWVGVAVGLCIAGAMCPLRVQAATFDVHEVAFYEDPVPGIPQTFTYFQDLTFLDDGTAYFKATDSSISSLTNRGLYKGSTTSPISPVAQIGSTQFPSGFVPANRYDVSQSGTSIFDYVSSGTKLYMNAGGPTSTLITNSTTNQTISGHTGRFGGSIDRMDINDAGRFAFATDFGSTAHSPIVKGLFTATSDSDLASLAWEDEPAPGIAGAEFSAFSNVNITQSGDVYFSSGVTGPGITTANDNTFWRGGTGGLSLLAREADPAPGIPGRTWRPNTISDLGGGEFAVEGFADAAPSPFIRGLWFGDGPSTLAPVIQSTSDKTVVTTTDQGDIAFTSTGAFHLAGKDVYFNATGNLTSDDTLINGIWKRDATTGDVSLLVSTDTVPAGETGRFFSVSLVDANDAGQVAFQSTLFGVGKLGYWVRNTDGTFERVVQVDDEIAGKTVAGLPDFEAALNSEGALAFIAEFPKASFFDPDERGVYIGAIPALDQYVWRGPSATDNNWHTINVGESNWEDEEAMIWPTPPGAGGNEDVTIDMAAVVLDQTAASIGPLTVTSGSLTVQKPLTLNQASTAETLIIENLPAESQAKLVANADVSIAGLSLTSGALEIAPEKTVTLTGNSKWLSGTVGIPAGETTAGTLKVDTGAVLLVMSDGTGDVPTLDGVTLDQSGSLNITGAPIVEASTAGDAAEAPDVINDTLRMKNGAKITVKTDQTLKLIDGAVVPATAGAMGSIEVAGGTFGSGDTGVDADGKVGVPVMFTDKKSKLSVFRGTLTMEGGWEVDTDAPSFDEMDMFVSFESDRLNLHGGKEYHVKKGWISFIGNGTVHLPAGNTWKVSAGAGVRNGLRNFGDRGILLDGGTIEGDGAFTNDGEFQWTSGVLNIGKAGDDTVRFVNELNGSLEGKFFIKPGGTKTLKGRFENKTAKVTQTDNLKIDGASILNNHVGEWKVVATPMTTLNIGASGDTGEFENKGTLNITGTGGTVAINVELNTVFGDVKVGVDSPPGSLLVLDIKDSANLFTTDGMTALTGGDWKVGRVKSRIDFPVAQINEITKFASVTGSLAGIPALVGLNKIDGKITLNEPLELSGPITGTGEILKAEGKLTLDGKQVKVSHVAEDGTWVFEELGEIDSVIEELGGVGPPSSLVIDGTDAASSSHFTGTLTNGIDVGTGQLINHGTIRPGGPDAPGFFPLSGDLVQTTTGVIEVEIGGTTVGTEHDQVFVTESVTLSGTLSLSLLDVAEAVPFDPALGDTFQVFAFEDRAGTTFDQLTGAVQSTSLAFAPIWNDHDLTLRATVPGDTNFDNTVTVTDLSTLALNFGDTTGIGSFDQGDFNADGLVNVADLALLAINFGFDAGDPTSSPIGLSIDTAAAMAGIDPSTIPEPTTIWLIGASGLLLPRRLFRGHS